MPKHFKLLDKYIVDNSLKKTIGGQTGLFVRRRRRESKQSLWLAKTNNIYTAQTRLNQARAIKEAYAGVIYHYFMPNNVPKTRLFYETANRLSAHPVGSKFIPNFMNTHFTSHTQLGSLPIAEKIRLAKEIIKARYLSVLLGEWDFEINLDNSGFADCEGHLVFKKVDHGNSLALSSNYKSFAFDMNLMPKDSKLGERLSQVFDINNEKYKWEIIDEICNMDINKLKSIMLPFERMLDQYRGGIISHGEVGVKENTIAMNILERLSWLRNINNCRKALEHKWEKARRYQLRHSMHRYQQLLNSIYKTDVLNQNVVEYYTQMAEIPMERPANLVHTPRARL